MAAIDIKEGVFKAGQLLQIDSVNNIYPINTVTEKALLIESSDGKHLDNNTFISIWLPISQLSISGVNNNPDNSQAGIHIVSIPNWLVEKNINKW